MPKSTMKLFGYPRSRYEPELSILAKKRIADGHELLKEYANIRKAGFPQMTQFDIENMLKDYASTAKAIRWWEKILLEE